MGAQRAVLAALADGLGSRPRAQRPRDLRSRRVWVLPATCPSPGRAGRPDRQRHRHSALRRCAQPHVHFHTLTPDGVWAESESGELRFHPIAAPSKDELDTLQARIAQRVRRLLVRRGLWDDDEDGGRPAESGEVPALAALYGPSIAQRGDKGRHLSRLGAMMRCEPGTQLGQQTRLRGGFDLHASVVVSARRRSRLEHLCRYLLRPALANDRLQPLEGDLLLALKKRWDDGTTHLRLTKSELLDRLAAIIPRPRANQILYHGVFSANAAWRSSIVPDATPARPRPSAPRRPNHGWADLMRRGLDLDVLLCPRACGARLRLLALVQEPHAIQRILRHLGLPHHAPSTGPARAPPESGDVDWAS